MARPEKARRLLIVPFKNKLFKCLRAAPDDAALPVSRRGTQVEK